MWSRNKAMKKEKPLVSCYSANPLLDITFVDWWGGGGGRRGCAHPHSIFFVSYSVFGNNWKTDRLAPPFASYNEKNCNEATLDIYALLIISIHISKYGTFQLKYTSILLVVSLSTDTLI